MPDETSMVRGRSRQNRSDVASLATQKLLDSRRLLYFYHVAKAGRFTAAEAILDVAQSAMSRQIQQLEADLGTQLLERTGHGVKLTPYGKILYRDAEEILQRMAATIDEIAEARHKPLGSISIAAPPSFMATYMADIILEFNRECPGIRICALEASTGGVYTLLANGEVDLAIVLQPTNTARLVLSELAVQPLYVIAAPDHPVAAQKSVARHQLKELELVLPASLYGSRALLGQYFADEDVPMRSNIEADSLPLILELLQRKALCTILPRITCNRQLDEGTLVARTLVPALQRTLYIAALRDRPQTPHVDVLKELIVSIVTRYEREHAVLAGS